jgi:hypothetical protein
MKKQINGACLMAVRFGDVHQMLVYISLGEDADEKHR